MHIFELLLKLLPKSIHCEYDHLDINITEPFVLIELPSTHGALLPSILKQYPVPVVARTR